MAIRPEQSYTRDECLKQLPAQRDHSQFPPARPAEMLTGGGAMGGSFTMSYTAVVVTAARS